MFAAHAPLAPHAAARVSVAMTAGVAMLISVFIHVHMKSLYLVNK
jgi:hypothetical protein